MTSLPAGLWPRVGLPWSTVNGISGVPGAWVITLAGNPNTALSRPAPPPLPLAANRALGGSSGSFVYLNGGVLQVTASMTLAESSSAGTTPTSSQNRQVWIGPAGGGIDITNNSTLNLNTSIYEAGGLNGGPSAFTLTSSDFALGAATARAPGSR